MSDPQSRPADESVTTTGLGKDEVSRRIFNQLSMAAFSGLMAGSIVGCSGEEEKTGGTGTTGGTGDTGGSDATGGTGTGGEGTGTEGVTTTDGDSEPFSWLTAEKHVCRGLNSCENKGASGENACAGQGTCATAAHITCAGQNACKGQGGCGEHPGEYACKEQGSCHVPLQEGAMWEAARERFEAALTEAGKEFGEAPAAL